jgi:hypothetical protein
MTLNGLAPASFKFEYLAGLKVDAFGLCNQTKYLKLCRQQKLRALNVNAIAAFHAPWGSCCDEPLSRRLREN